MGRSTRRAALAACAALFLVTAGCSSGANPTSTTARTDATTPAETTEATATTSPTTTTQGTWSPNASVGQYPPGVADNGTLVNASALVDAHVAATANRSIAFTSAWTLENESHLRRYVRGASETPYYSVYNRTIDGWRDTEQFYSTGSRGYARMTFENETVYSVLQNAHYTRGAWTRDSSFDPQSTLWLSLNRGNYTVNGTVERGDRTFVQLTADEAVPDKKQFVSAYEGTVLVTPEGRRLRHRGILRENPLRPRGTGRRREQHSRREFDNGRHRVEWSGPPRWVAELPQLSLSIVENGHAVEIRNTGGETLPANATFRADGSTEPVFGPAPRPLLRSDDHGTVTTESPLEPGDAVYVTAGADGKASSFALHDDPTRGEYAFASASLREGYDNVYYRLLTGIESPPWQNESSYRAGALAHPLGLEASRHLNSRAHRRRCG